MSFKKSSSSAGIRRRVADSRCYSAAQTGRVCVRGLEDTDAHRNGRWTRPRPFYRLGAVRFIGPVPKADFVAFLRSKFEGSGYRIEDDAALQAILDFAEEVPYNVQMLAHACWDQLRTRPQAKQPFSPRVSSTRQWALS